MSLKLISQCGAWKKTVLVLIFKVFCQRKVVNCTDISHVDVQLMCDFAPSNENQTACVHYLPFAHCIKASVWCQDA